MKWFTAWNTHLDVFSVVVTIYNANAPILLSLQKSIESMYFIVKNNNVSELA